MTQVDGIDVDTFAVTLAGDPVLRLSIGLELFFPRPLRLHRAEVLAVWEALLAWRGRDVMTWARLGRGTRSRRMTKAAHQTIAAWLDGRKDHGRMCFITAQDGDFEQLGHHGFRLIADDTAADDASGDTTINALQIRLPLSTADDPADLAVQLRTLAAPLGFVGGTAGLMLQATPFGAETLWPQMADLVTRFSGLQPDAIERDRWRAHLGLTNFNWLTFVGARHLATLGGMDVVAARARVAGAISATPMGAGCVLQAGDRPRLGGPDTGAAELAAYRAVAAIGQPALHLDVDYAMDVDAFDGRRTVAWLQRFYPTPGAPRR